MLTLIGACSDLTVPTPYYHLHFNSPLRKHSPGLSSHYLVTRHVIIGRVFVECRVNHYVDFQVASHG